MIGTISTQLVPPWPGPLPTPNDGTWDTSINRGWIFPEFYSDFATYRGLYNVPPTKIYKIAKPHDTAMKRFIRFYFVSDTSFPYDGWEIEIKPSSSGSTIIPIPVNGILYTSLTSPGKTSDLIASDMKLGYAIMDSSNNTLGSFALSRINLKTD